jgi:hypothetical protein
MKRITIDIPSNKKEFEPWLKKWILSYDKLGSVIFVLTFTLLALGLMGDATQSDQRWTAFWGAMLYLWCAFLIFNGKSADLVNRKWWIWMLIALFFPFIAIVASVIFRTTKPTR